MVEYHTPPDIIKYKTPILHLGNLSNEKIFHDDLIPEEKTSNYNIPSNGAWLYYEDTLGYFKIPITNGSFLKELLGVKITKYFNLPTVEYQLAEASWGHKNIRYYGFGLFSKYARKNECQYHTLETIYDGEYDSDNLSILNILDDIYSDQPIIKQMRYFIVRDFLTQEYDRIPSEILIENNKGKINIGPLMDYEMEWIDYPDKEYKLKGYLTFNLDNPEIKSQVQNDEYFKEALERLMDIDITKLLKEIQEENQIRLIDYDIENFKSQEKKIKEYVKTKKIL